MPTTLFTLSVMSESNNVNPVSAAEGELIQRAYAAFNHRDIEAALATMHPDVDWPNGMEGGRVVGHPAIRAYWTRQWSQFSPHVEPLHLTTNEAGQVVVEVHQVIRDLAEKVIAEATIQHLYRLEAGLICRMDIRTAGSEE